MGLNIQLIHDEAMFKISQSAAELRATLERSTEGQVPGSKFVVLHRPQDYDDILLVVGPVYDTKLPDAPYFHGNLAESAGVLMKEELPPLQGGGFMTFSKASKDWMASIGGHSRMKGVWSPTLLLHREAVAQWLGMACLFEWSNWARPNKTA